MILVCVKWVALRPDVDPLTGDTTTDARWSGLSAADQAALELGLELGAQRNASVCVLTVGLIDAEAALQEALAAGASKAVRIDAPDATTSRAVANQIANYVNSVGAHTIELVLCGDWSVDRGSGSVPVFIAEALGLDDACGLVSLTPNASGALHGERRLDGGRREKLEINTPAVVSVEGVTARLRRATIQGILAAKSQTIEVWRPVQPVVSYSSTPLRVGPYRPPTRVLDGPATTLSPLRRVEILTGAHSERTPPRKVVMEPEDAADAILEQLAAWGYDLPGRNVQ